MKALSVSLFLALGLVAAVGCAAPAEGEVAGEETATQAANEANEENVESQSAALINTSSSGGLGWSAKCKACKDKCDVDFPGNSTGPNQTCKQLCVRAGTCDKVSGPGVIGVVMY